ncbi:hypothetical protein [Acetobacterium woodii]|uniref:hypothetical protein n=1 Tax=Acetobacterium woodii TaxID=33952 RepID=UPI0002DD4F88|nr:hypothetical protein [Acetobacterium woodii]
MTTTELETLKYMLLGLINGGAIFRVGYCFFQMIHENEREVYIKRIRNVFVFMVMANALFVFKDTILHYVM